MPNGCLELRTHMCRHRCVLARGTGNQHLRCRPELRARGYVLAGTGVPRWGRRVRVKLSMPRRDVADALPGRGPAEWEHLRHPWRAVRLPNGCNCMQWLGGLCVSYDWCMELRTDVRHTRCRCPGTVTPDVPLRKKDAALPLVRRDTRLTRCLRCLILDLRSIPNWSGDHLELCARSSERPRVDPMRGSLSRRAPVPP